MMDMMQDGAERDPVEDHAIDAPPPVARDERRMHVRAYNVWAALLRGRQFPAIADLDPARVGDFAANGVLLDLSADAGDPGIAWLGEALQQEGGLVERVRRIADVPERSLLSRLTRHCSRVIANRAPVGFEDESVNVRENLSLYRGILMPFSSDGEAIDFVYGVVNWKELVDPATAAEIVAAARAAMASAPAAPAAALAPVWADGPSGSLPPDDADHALDAALDAVRSAGRLHAAAEQAARDALVHALGAAYDFAAAAEADMDGYAATLAKAGIAPSPPAPWRPILTLLFGEALAGPLAAEYAAALAHAYRQDVAPGAVPAFLTACGGVEQAAAADRAYRRAARSPSGT